MANEKGNTMIFMLGSMSMLFLMFVIVGSFANVFIIKEKASNNAEQASIAASGEILSGLKTAIDEYDRFQFEYYSAMERLDLYDEDSILKKLAEEKTSLSARTDLSSIEVNHNAINRTIKAKLPGIANTLKDYVSIELEGAKSKVIQVVKDNIQSNNGELSGSVIMFFNNNKRVEVKTATKYKAIKYDHFFPDDERLIKQKGEGLKFSFLDGFGPYEWAYTFP